MGQHVVCHVSKGKGASKGLTEHNERERMPKNADPKLAHLNVIEDFKHLGITLEDRAKKVIENVGVKRKIQDDAVLYCPIILSGSNKTMKKIMKEGKLAEWMADNRNFIEKKYGKDKIISFALHADETTPHIHCSIVPIIQDKNKKGKEVTRLSARDVFNGWNLKELQSEYAQAMSKWGLERGQDTKETRAKHQDVSQAYRDLPEKTKELEEKIEIQYEDYNHVLKDVHDARSAAEEAMNKAEAANGYLEEFHEALKKLEPVKNDLERQILSLKGEKELYEDILAKTKKTLFGSPKKESIAEEFNNKFYGLEKHIEHLKNELRKQKYEAEKAGSRADTDKILLEGEVRTLKNNVKAKDSKIENLENAVAYASQGLFMFVQSVNTNQEQKGTDIRYIYDEKMQRITVPAANYNKGDILPKFIQDILRACNKGGSMLAEKDQTPSLDTTIAESEKHIKGNYPSL